MRILMGTLEMAPFLKVGGVADALAGLACALVHRGHHVTVALPRRDPPVVGSLPGVDVVTLDVAGFERGSPYGHEIDDTGDSALRVGALGRALLALLRRAPWDVLHVHDWPLAMLPYVLKNTAVDFPVPRTVLTLHNASFHGLFPPHSVGAFGLGAQHAPRLLLDGMVSTVRAGILASDVVTTVSPRYARELATPDRSFGLFPTFRERGAPPVGILNGLDQDAWNPLTDPALPARFDAAHLEGRAECKRALLQETGLPVDLGAPLVVHAGRLHPEKGVTLLAEVLPFLVQSGAQVLVAGQGDPEMERRLDHAVQSAGGRARSLGWAPPARMRRLLAGADMVVIPSFRESCGLVQMEAQRYGAIPVATHTGGLADTITDGSTGFLVPFPRPEDLQATLERALRAYRAPGWTTLQQRAMALDRNWDAVAARYEQVYLA